MYAVTKTYKDFNGVERTETKLFNLTETEVMEMELGTAGGVAEMLQRIVDAKDQPTIIKFFKEFILKAYGHEGQGVPVDFLGVFHKKPSFDIKLYLSA